MKLLLIRNKLSPTCTLGDLCLNGPENGIGKWFCYTLEDPWREKKVYGDTCIPEGTYEIVITYSNRFKRELPLLLNVPGFEGIRMHGGTTKEHTLGCVLLGTKRGLSSISNCAPAVEGVMKLLRGSQQRDKNYITIRKAEQWLTQ